MCLLQRDRCLVDVILFKLLLRSLWDCLYGLGVSTFAFQSGRRFSGLSMFRIKYTRLRSHDANFSILYFIIVYYYFAVTTVISLLAMMLLISDQNHV